MTPTLLQDLTRRYSQHQPSTNYFNFTNPSHVRALHCQFNRPVDRIRMHSTGRSISYPQPNLQSINMSSIINANTPAKAHWTRWLWLSLIVLVLDFFTKQWVTNNMSFGESRMITSWFNLVSARNTGAAFSFLANAGGWQRWFFIIVTSVVSIGLLVFLRKNSSNKIFATAMALVLGGAIGNLYDRVMFGYVVDFVQWHYNGRAWPAFNIADSAICLGVTLMLIDSFRKQPSEESQKKTVS